MTLIEQSNSLLLEVHSLRTGIPSPKALAGEASPEDCFLRKMLPTIAPTTGRQDVGNEVRPSPRERDPMVRL